MTRISDPIRSRPTQGTQDVHDTNANAEVTSPSTPAAKRADDFAPGAATTHVEVDRSRLRTTSGMGAAEITDPGLLATLSAERAKGSLGAGVGTSGSGSGHGLNANAEHLESSSGPIPKDDWSHPERIVGGLTQTPAGGADVDHARDRCGPSNLLGAAIMAGPASAQRFLHNASTSPRLSPAEQKELKDIAGAVGKKTATFEQLSRAQGLLYKAGNTRGSLDLALDRASTSTRLNERERQQVEAYRKHVVDDKGGLSPQGVTELSRLLTKAEGKPVEVKVFADPQHPSDRGRDFLGVKVGDDASGFDDAEIQGLARGGGARPGTVKVDYGAEKPLEDALGKLKPGESITLRVQSSSDADSGGNFDPDHFITIGKGADGTPYVYNPDPASGDFTLFTGNKKGRQPDGFSAELRKYEGRLSVDNDGDQPLAVKNTWVQ
jgi:hypothetical protein